MTIFVREAEQEDILQVIHLLKKFAGETALKDHFSERAVGTMVGYSLMNGCCFVAIDKGDKTEREEGRIIGVILGCISVNPWTNSSRELREVAWYVEKEHRGSKAGIKLYQRYTDHSKELIESKDIAASFIATLVGSGESAERLVSQDFHKLESHYIMGG